MSLVSILAGPLVSVVGEVIKSIFPNPTEQEKVRLEQLKTSLSAELAIHEINKTEAGHPSMFVAGWRPFIGWVCGIGILYVFLLQPLLAWGALVLSVPVPPTLDIVELMALVSGMLGMTTARTVEGLNGVKRSVWKNPDDK